MKSAASHIDADHHIVEAVNITIDDYIVMPSQLVFLQLHNTLRQDTSPSQVSTVVKPSDCLVHRSWNIFGFNLIEQEDNNDDSDANDAAEGDDDYLGHRS